MAGLRSKSRHYYLEILLKIHYKLYLQAIGAKIAQSYKYASLKDVFWVKKE